MEESNSNSLVSIIVPVYNVELYLDKCVKSLVEQTYHNIEILLVDDGSVDDSSQKCDIWGKKDNRIKVFHKENGGVSSARNVGLKNCTGKYILFVDSDDSVQNNYVEIFINIIIKNNCDLGITNYNFEYENGEFKKNIFKTPQKNLTRHDFFNYINEKDSYQGFLFNKVFLKEIIEKYNFEFDENVHYAEDLLFLMRYVNKIEKIYFEYDEYPVNYFCRNDSATRTSFNSKTATFMNVSEEFIDIFKENDVESGSIKKKFISCYFLAFYCLKDKKNYSKKEYKMYCKKYIKDILNSKYVTPFEKCAILGLMFCPNTMKILRDIKKFLERR